MTLPRWARRCGSWAAARAWRMRFRSSASALVSPMIGATMNSTLQSSGLRPWAAMRAADVVAIGFHRVDALGVGDDGVGVAGSEFAAAWRSAGLGDDRLALRRRAGVQRAARLVELALVIHRVDLGVVDQRPGLAVGDDRAGFPRTPELAHRRPCIRRPCRSADRVPACRSCRSSSPRSRSFR